MSSKTPYIGSILELDKKIKKYKPINVKQKFELIPNHTNTKKSSKGGKSKKRRTYKKKRNGSYLKR